MKFCEHFKLVVVIVALAYASAADKGDGDLLKVLAKETKELSDVFKKENVELRRDDQKLRERDEKLHDRIDKMAEQMSKQNVEMAEQMSKLVGKNDKMAEQIGKQNEKMSQQNEQIVNVQAQNNKLHQKLKRQSDSPDNSLQGNLIKFFHERDENGTFGVEETLKHFVKSEIKEYLISERICVSGTLSGGGDGRHKSFTTTHHVNFGYSFPRKPTVSVAISYLMDTYIKYYWKSVQAGVSEVTKSSAKISVEHKDTQWIVSWIACL